MDTDPFSTACIEPRTFTLNKEKTEPPLKRVEFFSKIGRKRLQKIWDDNNLDEEVLFTGFEERGASRDSFRRETVSDYVQHYLIKRMRRLSLERKLSKSVVDWNMGKSERKMFREYEDFITDKKRKQDELRITQEVERLTKLLLSGRVRHAPVDFKNILKDPIFKINRLMDSVRDLEYEEIKVHVIPFEIETMKIKNVDELQSEKNVNSLQLQLQTAKNMDILATPATDNGRLICLVSESDLFSMASEFNESDLNPVSELPSSALSLSRKAYLVEFPVSEQDRARSFSVISELTDEELGVFAEKRFADEDITGELELEEMCCAQDENGPLALVKVQNSCDMMYKIASDIVGMFQRQRVAGDEFMDELSARYFSK